MENSFLPEGNEIVSRAIAADNEGEYDKALELYREALSRFALGLRCEKDETTKALIKKKVDPYYKRAKKLRGFLDKQVSVDRLGAAVPRSSAGMKRKGDREEELDDDLGAEKQKLRGALSDAVVTEKPHVKWDSVAGLAQAKETLKETVILPKRFPQLFTGKRRPFKGILLYGPPGTGELIV